MKAPMKPAIVLVHATLSLLFGVSSSALAQRPARDKSDIMPLLTVRHAGEATSVAFSPDGKRLAAGSGHRGIRVWDAATGKPFWETSGDAIGDFVTFSP